jgi:hypothetical protein
MGNISGLQSIFLILLLSICLRGYAQTQQMPLEFQKAIQHLQNNQPSEALEVLESSSLLQDPFLHLLMAESYLQLDKFKDAEKYYLMPMVTNYPKAKLNLGWLKFVGKVDNKNYIQALHYLVPLLDINLSKQDEEFLFYMLGEIYRQGQPSLELFPEFDLAKKYAFKIASMGSWRGQSSFLKILLSDPQTTELDIIALNEIVQYRIDAHPPNDKKSFEYYISEYNYWLELIIEQDLEGKFSILWELMNSSVADYRITLANTGATPEDASYDLDFDIARFNNRMWDVILANNNNYYLRLLLNSGMNPFKAISGNAPIYKWISDEEIIFDDNEITLLKTIAEEGIAINNWFSVSSKKTTLLHLATHYQRKKLVMFLLENGFKKHINLRDEAYNLTPLELSVYDVDSLYDNELTVLFDDEGPTFDMSTKLDMAKYLLSQNANPNFSNPTLVQELDPELSTLIDNAVLKKECKFPAINSFCWQSKSQNVFKRVINIPETDEDGNTSPLINLPELVPQVNPTGLLDNFLINRAKEIVVTQQRDTITLWKLSTGQKIRQLETPTTKAINIQLHDISNDGRYIYAFGYSKQLFVWSSHTGQLLENINHESNLSTPEEVNIGNIYANYFDISSRFNRILLNSYTGIVLVNIKGNTIYEIVNGENRRFEAFTNEEDEKTWPRAIYNSDILMAGLSKSSQFISLVSESGEISLWQTGSEKSTHKKQFSEQLKQLDIHQLFVSNKGKSISIVTNQGLWLWQPEKDNLLQLTTTEFYESDVDSLLFKYSDNERYLFKSIQSRYSANEIETRLLVDLDSGTTIKIPSDIGTNSQIEFEGNKLVWIDNVKDELEVKGVTHSGVDVHFIVNQEKGTYHIINDNITKPFFTYAKNGTVVDNLNNLGDDEELNIHFESTVRSLSFSELKNLKSVQTTQKFELSLNSWQIETRERKLLQNLYLNDDRISSSYTFDLTGNAFTIQSNNDIHHIENIKQTGQTKPLLKSHSQLNITPTLSNNGDYILFLIENKMQLWHIPTGRLQWETQLESQFYNIEFLPGDKQIRLIEQALYFQPKAEPQTLKPKMLLVSVENGREILEKEYEYNMIDRQALIGAVLTGSTIEIHSLNKNPSLLFSTKVEFKSDGDAIFGQNTIETIADLSSILIRYNNIQQLWQNKSQQGYQQQFEYKQSNPFAFPSTFDNKNGPIDNVDEKLRQKLDYRLSFNGKWLIGKHWGENYVWSLSDLGLKKIVSGSITDLDHAWLLEDNTSTLVDSKTFEVLDTFDDINEVNVLIRNINISNDNKTLIGIDNNRVFLKNLENELPALYYTVFEGGKGIDWTWFNALGYFDSNNLDNMDQIVWVFHDEPLTPLTAEVFLRDFYSPGLLSAGQSKVIKMNHRDFNKLNRVLPSVEINEIEYLAESHQARIQLTVKGNETEQQKSGAYDLHLLLNGRVIQRYPASAGYKDIPTWRKATAINFGNNNSFQTEFTVDLSNDINQPIEFSAYAFNYDRIKSINAITKTIPKKQLQVKGNKARAWILSIGVNDNITNKWRLSYASPSAELLGERLKNKLIASGEFSEVNLLALFTQSPREIIVSMKANKPLNPVPNKSNIKAIIKKLSGAILEPEEKLLLTEFPQFQNQLIGPDDFLFISFSGHGISDSEEKEFYLLPYDSASSKEEGLYESAISSAELASWLTTLPATQAVLFLDTCTSGTALNVHDFKPAPLGNAGLGQLAYNKGMAIFVASEAGAEANAVGISLANYQFINVLDKQTSISNMQQLQKVFNQASKQISLNNKIQKPTFYYFPRKALTPISRSE